MARGDRPTARAVGGVAAAIAAIAGLTILFFQFIPAKPTTVASSYLVAILIISTQRSVIEATGIAILASLCFNVFFLSPVGTLTIADPQDWASFLAFTATAIVARSLPVVPGNAPSTPSTGRTISNGCTR